MPNIEELMKERKRKLELIKKAGFLAYPSENKRTHEVGQAVEQFDKISENQTEIVLSGRIMAIRTHGKAAFVDFQDGTGKIQAHLREDKLGEKGYKFFSKVFDIGDFIEIKGGLFLTKRG